MIRALLRRSWIVRVLLLTALTTCALSQFSEGPAPRHGGRMVSAGDFYFEIVLRKEVLQVYPQDEWGIPQGGPRLRGRLRVRRPQKKALDWKLNPVADAAGAPTALECRRDLRKFAAKRRRIKIAVAGLPETPKATVFQVELGGEPSGRTAGSHSGRAGSSSGRAGSGSSHAGSGSARAPRLTGRALALANAQRPTYPLETCYITGAALDANGPPIEHIHKGRLLRFCCVECLNAFVLDPKTHLATFAQAKRGVPRQETSRSYGSY